MQCSLFLSLLLNLLLSCTAQAPSTYWVNPPQTATAQFYAENTVFQLGTDVKLKWVTDETHYSIYLWQQQPSPAAVAGSSIYSKQAGDAELGEITWTVTTQQFSLSKFPVFFFALGPTAALDNAWTSHYFNITKGPASTTTTSSTATTSSSTTTSGGTSSSVVSSATTSTTASTTSGQPGSAITVSVQSSSSGAEQIGLGVGLGIGIPIVLLLAALVAFIVYRSRRKNKRSRAESPSYQSDNGIRMKTYNHAPNGTRLSDEQQADLLIRSQPAELPSRRISTRLAELPSR